MRLLRWLCKQVPWNILYFKSQNFHVPEFMFLICENWNLVNYIFSLTTSLGGCIYGKIWVGAPSKNKNNNIWLLDYNSLTFPQWLHTHWLITVGGDIFATFKRGNSQKASVTLSITQLRIQWQLWLQILHILVYPTVHLTLWQQFCKWAEASVKAGRCQEFWHQ